MARLKLNSEIIEVFKIFWQIGFNITSDAHADLLIAWTGSKVNYILSKIISGISKVSPRKSTNQRKFYVRQKFYTKMFLKNIPLKLKFSMFLE